MRLDSTLKKSRPKKSRHFLMQWMSVKLPDNFQIHEHSWPCLFHIIDTCSCELQNFPSQIKNDNLFHSEIIVFNFTLAIFRSISLSELLFMYCFQLRPFDRFVWFYSLQLCPFSIHIWGEHSILAHLKLKCLLLVMAVINIKQCVKK